MKESFPKFGDGEYLKYIGDCKQLTIPHFLKKIIYIYYNLLLFITIIMSLRFIRFVVVYRPSYIQNIALLRHDSKGILPNFSIHH